MKPRVPSFSYKNPTDVLTADLTKSRMKPLNGPWKFHFTAQSENRPTDFFAKDFTNSGWKNIPVPSN